LTGEINDAYVQLLVRFKLRLDVPPSDTNFGEVHIPLVENGLEKRLWRV